MEEASPKRPRRSIDTFSEAEIDALVHQRVLGHSEPQWCIGQVAATWDRDTHTLAWRCESCGAGGEIQEYTMLNYRHQQPIPRYTRSIDAAWRIMEHFDGGGITAVRIMNGAWRYHVELVSAKRQLPRGGMTAYDGESASMVLCLAALVLIEVIDKQGMVHMEMPITKEGEKP